MAQCPPNLCTFVALRIVFLSTHTVIRKSIMSCSNFKLDAVNYIFFSEEKEKCPKKWRRQNTPFITCTMCQKCLILVQFHQPWAVKKLNWGINETILSQIAHCGETMFALPCKRASLPLQPISLCWPWKTASLVVKYFLPSHQSTSPNALIQLSVVLH